MTGNVPIFDRVANDQTMDKHLFILRNRLGVVVTQQRLKYENYLADPVDTIISLAFAVTSKVSIPRVQMWPVDVPLVIPR